MTRDHAALQLLAHGPLSRCEFREITGWPAKSCDAVVYRLRDAGHVRVVMVRRRQRYALARPSGAVHG